MEHEYDGIQEFDNPLPGWWSGIFVLSIVFAGVYGWWFHAGGPGESEIAQFEAKWAAYEQRRAAYEATARLNVTEALLADYAADPTVIGRATQLFQQNCVGCHLADGSGQTGPNLTDLYQLHGTTRLDLFSTIRDGVSGTAMLSWGATMRDRDVAALAAFVSTLRGKDLPGKAHEGARVEPW
jgi:cytochrome c oxidase cbb3-type subunit 3